MFMSVGVSWATASFTLVSVFDNSAASSFDFKYAFEDAAMAELLREATWTVLLIRNMAPSMGDEVCRTEFADSEFGIAGSVSDTETLRVSAEVLSTDSSFGPSVGRVSGFFIDVLASATSAANLFRKAAYVFTDTVDSYVKLGSALWTDGVASLNVRACFVGNINSESVDVRGLSAGGVDLVGVTVLSVCRARVGSFGNVVLGLGIRGIPQHPV